MNSTNALFKLSHSYNNLISTSTVGKHNKMWQSYRSPCSYGAVSVDPRLEMFRVNCEK